MILVESTKEKKKRKHKGMTKTRQLEDFGPWESRNSQIYLLLPLWFVQKCMAPSWCSLGNFKLNEVDHWSLRIR